MDEQTSTSGDDAQGGTFLGGGFGETDEEAGTSTTAEQVEAEHDDPSYLADATVPAEVQEQVTLTSDPGSIPDDDAFPSDVEGTGTDPSPGERNDPV